MRKYAKMTVALLLAFLLASQCFAATGALIPGGEAVGLELTLTKPCITRVEKDGAAEHAGLKEGDCIVSVNASGIRDVGELAQMIAAGQPLTVTVERNGKTMTYTVYPEQTQNGWRIGAEVMDSISGIGTITYIDPKDKSFGALGHGVNLPNCAKMLPAAGGTVYDAEVTGVEKSEKGEPGELKGRCTGRTAGTVDGISDSGVFGTLGQLPRAAKRIPVAEPEQVHSGDAVIRCCLQGKQVREYSVQIVEVYPQSENGRDLLLKITDRELLAQTGGIVRGMSGSPIIQDDRLVGAVTHVLVDQPSRGYGIFIQNMLGIAA